MLCESALSSLDLFITPKKSVCMRIGPRCNGVCCDIVSSHGYGLHWVKLIRYIGVHFVSAKQFKCSFNNATASFYGAFNAIFGRIGRSGSEEVIIQLINSKFLPCLLYALEACPVKTQERSLEFTVNKVIMKVFRTISMDVLTECRLWFGISEIKVLIARRKLKFLRKFIQSINVLCQMFAEFAHAESSTYTYSAFGDRLKYIFYLLLCFSFCVFMLAATWRNKVD